MRNMQESDWFIIEFLAREVLILCERARDDNRHGQHLALQEQSGKSIVGTPPTQDTIIAQFRSADACRMLILKHVIDMAVRLNVRVEK